MPPRNLTVSILTVGVLRLLPEHIDLFTACDGGAGIGGVLGGGIAMLAGKNIATGGIVGGIIGIASGSVVAILPALGIHS